MPHLDTEWRWEYPQVVNEFSRTRCRTISSSSRNIQSRMTPSKADTTACVQVNSDGDMPAFLDKTLGTELLAAEIGPALDPITAGKSAAQSSPETSLASGPFTARAAPPLAFPIAAAVVGTPRATCEYGFRCHPVSKHLTSLAHQQASQTRSCSSTRLRTLALKLSMKLSSTGFPGRMKSSFI